MKIVFMGTPDFAVPCLESLINSKHTVLGVFTQPDKPRGRKQILTPPDVKVCALKHELNVYQPATLKDGKALEIIKKLSPDVIIVVAYGKILPEEILTYPKYGCINVHGSLLPRYRGAAPIQWSVLNGDKETGVTTMLMEKGLDTGDILLQESISIGENDTSEDMYEKLAPLGAKLLLKTLDDIENNKIVPQKQDDSLSNYASMLDKSMCELDFSQPAQLVHNKVRGLYSWPVALTYLGSKKLKIFKTRVCDKCGNPGEIISLNPFTVACGNKSVEIIDVQLEGKKRMDSKSFIMGYNIKCGNKLGKQDL